MTDTREYNRLYRSPKPLSPRGERRKQEIHDHLLHVLHRRRVRLLAVRGGVLAAAAIIIGVWSIAFSASPAPDVGQHASSDQLRPHADQTPRSKSARYANIRFSVAHSAAVAHMIAEPAEPSPVEYIDDDALLDLLAQTGADVGLARVGGKAILLDNAPEPDTGL